MAEREAGIANWNSVPLLDLIGQKRGGQEERGRRGSLRKRGRSEPLNL